MGRNTTKLYYPVKESVASILPLVDEFIFALGKGDEDDRTREELLSLNSDKIKILDTVWDIEKYPRGMEHAHQTDIARKACQGDWLFYLQSDEVVHEKFLARIRQQCENFLDDPEVEGFLFDYIHFWGDYEHYADDHCWYRNEIRIIRNHPDIHSWESAQSFRRIPDFDGLNYRQQENTFKLKVVPSGASIYHYGWVRPPELMQRKIKSMSRNHNGHAVVKAEEKARVYSDLFDYGNIAKFKRFTGSHPQVMRDWISSFSWKEQLRYSGPKYGRNKHRNKHEKLKYRLISWIEKYLLFGHRLGEFKNYRLIKKEQTSL